MPKAKSRDPNKPKRALTGFMFYSKERRQAVMKEFPEMKFVDVGKRLGDEWKAMNEQAKKPYEDLAKQDKERYKDAMVDYTPDEKFQKKGSRRDPNKLKRKISAYLYFCDAMRETVKSEFPEKKMVEIQRVLGLRWNELSEQERRPYELQANADRERYDAGVLKLANRIPEEGDDEDDDENNNDDEEDEDDFGELDDDDE